MQKIEKPLLTGALFLNLRQEHFFQDIMRYHMRLRPF